MAKLVNKHIRITEQQDQHLLALSAKTGYNVNELIRKILDNIDDVTLTTALSRQQATANREMQLLASRKYIMDTLSRTQVFNNINQIAHYVNKYPDNDLGKELVNAFNIVSKRIDELRSDINEHC